MKCCRLIVLLSLLLVSGCETVSYYSQAAQGQWSLWWQRQPIDRLVADNSLDPALRQRLQQVLDIRRFASSQLHLPDNDSYRYYSDLQRNYVVWNVFATPEFSVSPRQWCFPIAGCVSYRGYFSEQAARRYADKLKRQGYDTYVGGVAAYSTLGWFDDPVLNTFIKRDEVRLAGLIFHELAHQQLYVAGDTAFNESFASAVEVAGIERWLAQKENSEQMAGYLHDQQMYRDFVAMLLRARTRLETLYQQDIPVAQKRLRKQQLFDDIVTIQYPAFKAAWATTANVNNSRYYDRWISQTLNNAKLSTLASYYQWQPAFQRILQESGGDMQQFYRRAEALSRLDKAQRRQRLNALAGITDQ